MTQEDRKPENNPFLRFSDIIPQERICLTKVTLVGAGGIGAPAALALAKMGVHQMTIWDPDTIGEENIGPQMYAKKHVGKFKVDVLRAFLKVQAPWCKVITKAELYTDQTVHDSDVMVVTVDSLRARKEIWASVNPDITQLLVDARMGAEVLNVFSVLPEKDGEWYLDSLQGEAVEAKCTAKSTFHTGMIAGAMAAGAVKAWLCEERDKVEYTLDLRFINLFGMNSETKHRVFKESQESAA
jgi:hypothetical protein